MLTNTLRKIAIIATMAFAFVGLAACANESEGNDAMVDTTTTTVVTTTAEDKEKTEATNTTTTTAVTTAEPEKTEEVTTTTEATTTTVATTAEPEITETEATTAEASEETGIVTMADNPDGMYPFEECFRRKAEEYSKQKVISIDIDSDNEVYEATLEDGQKAYLSIYTGFSYNPDELYSIDIFEFVGYDMFGYAVTMKLSH